MKHIVLALAAMSLCAAAHANTPTDVPKPKCEPKPKYPGRAMMGDKMVRRTFDSDMKNYRECMLGYVEQRKTSIKAHEEAANNAINEFNATMKELQDAEKGN